MASVKLTLHRHKAPVIFDHDSIAEAARDAISQLDNDLAFPVKIERNGKLVWRFSSLATMREELEKLAGKRSESED